MTAPAGPDRSPIHWAQQQWVLRRRWGSARVARRSVVMIAVLAVLAVMAAIFALGVGEYPVAPRDVVSVLLGRDHTFNQVVVVEWRLPRIVLALLFGAALGMSGAIFQALTRNPLGSPDIIGFNVGAYTGALIVIASIGANYYLTAAGALMGGLVVAAIVYALARKNGAVQGFRLIVVGIAVAAVMNSVNQWIIIKVDLHTAITAALWSQGSLNGLEWAQAVPVAVCFLVVTGALAVSGSTLGVMQMGDDAAGALGINPERARIVYFILGIALVAVVAAAAGPISFVALAAPQIARRLTASAGVGLVSSAAIGAVLLLVSDLIAVTIFSPNQLPVGAVTTCVGGAYLVYLLIASARKANQ